MALGTLTGFAISARRLGKGENLVTVKAMQLALSNGSTDNITLVLVRREEGDLL